MKNRCQPNLEDGKVTDKWYLTCQENKKKDDISRIRGESARSWPGKGLGVWATASSEWKSMEELVKPP